MDAATQAKLEVADRPRFRRALEVLPGAITWSLLLAPVALSLIRPILVVYFIIAFDLWWLSKSLRLAFYLIRGYRQLGTARKIDWRGRLAWLEDLDGALAAAESDLTELLDRKPQAARRFVAGSGRGEYRSLKTKVLELQQLVERQQTIIKPAELINVLLVATYNESREILEPTIKSIIKSDFEGQQMILAIAYEERGGAQTESNAQELVKQFGAHFRLAIAIKHPDGLPGEARAKGSNISYAAKQLAERLIAEGLDPEKVIVTTLDADNRPDPKYLAYLTYVYATDPNRVHRSFQPIPMFYNNIWDAPAPMRVIAVGNSFWTLMEAMRPHRLRNFAAHAQGLQTLIDTDYWSRTSIVEDGHQYWRTYFTYEGNHAVVPIFVPIFQDAVLADGYLKTFKAQYLQLRRWAWGASDIPYVIENSLRHKRIPWSDKLLKLGRLIESHVSWGAAPITLTFVAWLPLTLSRAFDHSFSDQIIAHQLPLLTSRILTIGIIGQITTVFISLVSLPPRPARYRSSKNLSMLAQWVLLPLTAIVFSAFAALDAQTRLMFGRYLDFRTTDKAIKR